MTETYERPFRGLLSSIFQTHPQTARLLEALAKEFGGLAAFHAAEVILHQQAQVNMWGVEAAGVLTGDDFDALPFFELMSDNLPALERMVDVLECYAEECQMLSMNGVY